VLQAASPWNKVSLEEEECIDRTVCRLLKVQQEHFIRASIVISGGTGEGSLMRTLDGESMVVAVRMRTHFVQAARRSILSLLVYYCRVRTDSLAPITYS